MGEHRNKNIARGFTLIELLLVMSVIGVLALITTAQVIPRYHERTRFSRAVSEMNTMANALSLYASKYNDYPADTGRGIPNGIKEFIQAGGANDTWPDAPWPGSTYDYESWAPDAINSSQTYEIGIRFCAAGDTATCQKNFPKEPWVTSSWDSYSSVYYCISGGCRAHQSKPLNHPGYCINCGGATDVFKG
ncbi:MAG: type II secretion system protein [Patescibacteria group bacterium]|nr:type II secretion system protein [Patescibacteria group bacterium]